MEAALNNTGCINVGYINFSITVSAGIYYIGWVLHGVRYIATVWQENDVLKPLIRTGHLRPVFLLIVQQSH